MWATATGRHPTRSSCRYGELSDIGTVALAGLLSVLVLDDKTLGTGLVDDYGLSLAVGLGASLTFLARRHRPALCAVAAVGATLVTDDRTLMVFAAYALAQYGGRSRYGLCAGMALTYQAGRVWTQTLAPAAAVTDVRSLTAIAVPAVIGELMRRRNAAIAQLRRRIAQVELSVEQAARHTLLEERSRIVAGLHEDMGHEVTALVLQAGHLLRTPGLPETARPTALAVEAGARRVMADLRESAKVLQGRREALDHSTASLISYTELMAGLARNMETIGVELAFETTGTPRELPVRIERMVYRAALEALANAAKHAPGAPVTARLAFTADAVELEVTNGRAEGPRIHEDFVPAGLAALHEAVTGAGGTLTAGWARTDHFVLRARFGVTTTAAALTR
ncbi:histidine kinase [Streptomyces morookaense]|uniref:sensor histidine kinase n=1 Tax=Streptomyces morookaense TaxID=1970 RepID=UPI0034099760